MPPPPARFGDNHSDCPLPCPTDLWSSPRHHPEVEEDLAPRVERGTAASEVCP